MDMLVICGEWSPHYLFYKSSSLEIVMSSRKAKTITLLSAIVLAVSACSSVNIQAPKGVDRGEYNGAGAGGGAGQG